MIEKWVFQQLIVLVSRFYELGLIRLNLAGIRPSSLGVTATVETSQFCPFETSGEVLKYIVLQALPL